MLVTFTKTRDVEGWRQGADPVDRYEQGQIYDLPHDVAQHWIARGAATPLRPGPTAVGTTAVAVVEIPQDWKSGTADQVKALAATISGALPRNRAEAEATVSAELERRAAAEAA